MTNEDAATIGRANKSKKKVTAEENGEGAASVRLMNIPKKNRLKRKSDGSELSVNDTAGADVSVISPATTPTKARMKSLRNRKTIPSVAVSKGSSEYAKVVSLVPWVFYRKASDWLITCQRGLGLSTNGLKERTLTLKGSSELNLSAWIREISSTMSVLYGSP